MHFFIFSDTHFRNLLEVQNFLDQVKKNNIDLNHPIILAGDIFDRVWNSCGGMKKYVLISLTMFASTFKKVYLLLGNHEFFRFKEKDEYMPMDHVLNIFKTECLRLKIELIYRDHFVYIDKDHEITGCTLWVNENESNYTSSSNYRNVTHDINIIKEENKKDIEFLSKNHKEWHMKKGNENIKRIVVTHHMPRKEFVRPKTLANKERYANDIDTKIFEYVDYWICGHVHDSNIYEIGKCKLIINAMGRNGDVKIKWTPYDLS